MGQSTHVAVPETIIMMHTEPRGSGAGWGETTGANAKNQDPTMTAESYNRRSTDCGYIARTRSTLQALRKALGLLPVSESLQALQHWRRRPAKNET